MKLFASTFVAEPLAKVTGCEVLSLLPYDKLDGPVSTHADMLIFSLGKRIFCYEDYYYKNENIFKIAENEGYEIVKISSPTSAKYPSDIALNAFKIGNLICGKLKYVAKEIIEYAKALGFQLIDVKQGYSACSTLVLDDDTVVTADKSIYNALAKAGKRAVLISQGDIKLDGYDYGFIGGASCVIDDTVYFFGDIKKHKDYEKIHSEIARLKMKEKSISCEDVFDFGGARAI